MSVTMQSHVDVSIHDDAKVTLVVPVASICVTSSLFRRSNSKVMAWLLSEFAKSQSEMKLPLAELVRSDVSAWHSIDIDSAPRQVERCKYT